MLISSTLPLACGGGGEGPPPIVEPDPPKATTLILSPASHTFDALGDTFRVSATVRDQYGEEMSYDQILWGSTDASVVEVSQSGLVTSRREGVAKIRAQAGLVRDTVDMEVVQIPRTIEAISGDGQSHWTGFVLRDTLVVGVRDGAGTPVAGDSVTWTVDTGEGALLPLSDTTDSDGRARALWLLGTSGTGKQTVSATVPPLSPVVFQATASAPISIFSPASLSGPMLDTLDLTLLALDSLGAPEAGIPVEFLGIEGFGEVVEGPTTTGVNGHLVVRWILGPTPGTQSLTLIRADLNRLLVVQAQGTGTLDPWPFTTVSAGENHTCAIHADGSGYCWGDGGDYQLGTGEVAPVTKPAKVASALAWSEIAAGRNHSCALTGAGGAIYCWGDGYQTGQGGNVAAPTPLLVPGGSWSAVTAGQSHTCAVAAGGSGYCWGVESEGWLGNGVLASTGVPTLITGGLSWAGLYAGRRHTCGITTDGRGFCWGRGQSGQLGSGSTGAKTVPAEIAGGWRWQALSAGWDHSCGVATTGEALCWGEGSQGRLGNGSNADQTSPVKVAGDRHWTIIAAGQTHSCGIDTEKNLLCWGQAGYVGLGASGTSTPTVVLPGEEWASVESQGHHTCAVTTDGRTFCWGSNAYGQLGIGNTTDFGIPRLLVRSVILP